jgi:EAL domain-containing protein (putative c-di-GMP-specific phosphodiesterase class I)
MLLAQDGAEFTVARCSISDYRDISGALGPVAAVTLRTRVGERIADQLKTGEAYAELPDGHYLLVLAGVGVERTRRRLAELVRCASGWTGEVYGQLTAGGATACDAADADDLLAHADLAHAEAVGSGPGSVTVYGPELLAGARARVSLGADLRRAVEAGRLTVHYQPVVALAEGAPRVVGYEALARWPDHDRGWVDPDRFIPAAERGGLIGEIGMAVVRRALADRLRYAGAHAGWISVNVSPLQLDDDGFAAGLLGVLAEAGAPGQVLRVEVTESALSGSARARDQLDELRRHGVRVLVDDFGTGYSSLASLRRLPMDGIKIARELLHDDEPGLPDPTVVEAVRLLATGAGVTEIIAEGVESAAEVTALRALGVPYAQGFHLGRPAPASRAMRAA